MRRRRADRGCRDRAQGLRRRNPKKASVVLHRSFCEVISASIAGQSEHQNARHQRAVRRDCFGLFCKRCEVSEIHVRCSGKIGEGRPHCGRLVKLLRIDLVERVVSGVMGVEIIQSVLAERYYGHAGFLKLTNVVPAAKGWPAIEVGAERGNGPIQCLAKFTCRGTGRELYGIHVACPEICLTGDHDLAGFSLVGLGVGGAAEVHLLGAEQDDTNRAAGALRQSGDQTSGAEDDGNTGAIIGRAGAEIPGIKMPTDENDLIWSFYP